MAEFRIPELGENIAAGDVTRVLVKVGDTVAKDQPVIELETDKATLEVPCTVAGIVTAITVKPGDKVKIGQVVLVLDAAPAAGEPAAATAGAATQPSGYRVRPGEAVPGGEVAPEGGMDQHVMGRMIQHAPDKPGMTEAAEQYPRRGQVVDMPPRGGRGAALAALVPDADRPAAPAAPSVRRLAREIGVDVNAVQGSGPGGRITANDVKEHARRVLTSVGAAGTSEAAPTGARVAAMPLPAFEKYGAVERMPMGNIRRVPGERLSHAWQTIPHVTQYDKADITALDAMRKKYAPRVEQGGGKLTVTAIAVKVVAAALRTFPQFNASVDPERQEIVYKKFVHIGVAVDTDRGLLVPVIRDADRKSIVQIATELQQASEKARAKRLTLEDMEGGSFTISNLGGIGGTAFTPIVNWPEVAILGLSRGAVEPVWKDGAFVPRTMLPLSLSYDHRLIDGADGIRFLRWIVEALEQPFVLLLEG